ncbi:MAG: hypothetical protein ACTH6D_08000 [Vibrio litoralis]
MITTEYKLSTINQLRSNILKNQRELKRFEDKQLFSDQIVHDWNNNRFAQLKPLEEHYEYWLNWRDEYLECLRGNIVADQAILEGMLK